MTTLKCTCPDGPWSSSAHDASCPAGGQTPVDLQEIAQAAPKLAGVDHGYPDLMTVTEVPSPAQKARKEYRTSGDFAIHSQSVIDAALALGEPLHDGRVYVGLTHTRLIELLQELQSHREDRARLETWIGQNLPVSADRDKNPVIAAIRVMNDFRTVVTAAWPHLITLWGNISHVLQNAGIIAQHPRMTGDIHPVDRVSERPK